MDLDQLKQLLELVREHELSEFEVEQGGLRIKIRKDAKGQPAVVHQVVAAVPATLPMPAAAAPPAAPPQAPSLAYPVAEPDEAEVELAVVKSPIVGTFYRANEPGA